MNNFTSGRVYQDVLNKERRGDYLVVRFKLFHILQTILKNVYFAQVKVMTLHC
jgi:CTP synthase (UTP-ammonia lyase)